MKLWLDAQLPPALCGWLKAEYGLDAVAVRDLDMVRSEDPGIFMAARERADAVMTKDRDFVELVNRLGPPPKVIWITAGNTTNQHLKTILSSTLADALEALEGGESLVEIQTPS